MEWFFVSKNLETKANAFYFFSILVHLNIDDSFEIVDMRLFQKDKFFLIFIKSYLKGEISNLKSQISNPKFI